MGNSSGAGQGIVNGAKAGAQFGPVGAGIGAVVGGVIGYFSPDVAKEQRQAMLKYNAEVTRYTTQSLFDIQRQRVTERMRTSQALSTYQDNTETAISTLKAQYGAADVVGSSARALGMTVDFQTDQAMAQEWFNFDVGIDNYNTNVGAIVNRGLSSLSNKAGSYVNPNQAAALGSTIQTGVDAYAKYSRTQSAAKASQGTLSAMGLQLSSTPQSTQPSYMSSGDWSSINLGV